MEDKNFHNVKLNRLPGLYLYTPVCKLPHILISKNLKVLYTSKFTQSFGHYFALNYVSNVFLTQQSLK